VDDTQDDTQMIAPAMGRTAFVSGAAGVMGSRLCRDLVSAGWKVRALILPGDPLRSRLDGLGCEIHEGDIGSPESLRGACDGVDTVYHLAAVIISHDPSVYQRVNLDGTRHMVTTAAAAKVRHFIYVSSASVTYPKRTVYAESKFQAEALVTRERAFAHTIVRPTLVYDETGGQEFLMFLQYLRRFPVVPFVGAGRARKRPVWSGDVVDGLLRLAGNPLAHGKIYNFSGADAISIADLAHLMLAYHGSQKRFIAVPVWLCRVLAGVMGLCMTRPPLTTSVIAGIVNDADLDPGEAMRDLGYRPLGIQEGFARCFPRPVSKSVGGGANRGSSIHVSPSEGISP
jgi:NADH dehydrogenase